MMYLDFDSKAFSDAYKVQVVKIADDLAVRMLNDMKAGFKNTGVVNPDGEIGYARYDNDVNSAKYHEAYIYSEIINGVYAILDSFGTGSEMDRDNPALKDYFGSEYWNELRQGFEIMGRPEGWYTDIFGGQTYSQGTMVGMSVENIFKPRTPSYAIQNTEKLYFQGQEIELVLQAELDKWVEENFGKFLIEKGADV